MRDPDSTSDRPRPGRPLRPRAALARECEPVPLSAEQESLPVRTRAEVGARMGLSAERVRQIEEGALDKLRVRLRGLAEELGVVG